MAPNQGPVRKTLKTASEHPPQEFRRREKTSGGLGRGLDRQSAGNGLDGGQELQLSSPKLLLTYTFDLQSRVTSNMSPPIN